MSSSTRWAQEQEDDERERAYLERTKQLQQAIADGKIHLREGAAVFDEDLQSVVCKYDGTLWFSSMFGYGLSFKDKNGEFATDYDLMTRLIEICEPIVLEKRNSYMKRYADKEGFEKYQ